MKTILYGFLILVAALPVSLANAQTELPFPGKSWGGIVRDGPSLNAHRVTTLNNMQPIVILKQMDARTDGYPWFRISYNGGRSIGYQLGALICPNHISIVGTISGCDD